MMARNFVGKFFLGLVGFGMCVSGTAEARVITDWEASKLTLDALTATPVYHRPVTHHYLARATSRSRYASLTAHHASIRTVAYHYHARPVVASAHRAKHHRT